MPLPWVRLDSSIATHDKILTLLSDPSSRRWQAAASYMFALGWCGEHGTDGRVPVAALPFIHGTKQTAELLVKHLLWKPVAGGWEVPNYLERQELTAVAEAKRARFRVAGQKANCARWHGINCWQNGQCTRSESDST